MSGGPLLPPWVLQVFGLALILAFAIHAWTSGQESTLLVGAGVTLATWGTTSAGLQRLKRSMYKGEPHEDSDKPPE